MKRFDWGFLLLGVLLMFKTILVGSPFWRWPPISETSLLLAVGLRLPVALATLGAYLFVRLVALSAGLEY